MDAQVLMQGVAEMPISEMERFVQAINALITQKKATDKSYRERFLLGKINQTALVAAANLFGAEPISLHVLIVTALSCCLAR